MNMKAPQKFMSLVGAVALCSGMTFGIASAQTNDLPVSLDVTCSQPNTVTVTGDASMSYDVASLTGEAQTGPEAIMVEVNVGCYLGPWQVNAQITNFVAGPFQVIPGQNFSLEAGTVNAPWALIQDPVANDADFTQSSFVSADGDNAIFETYKLFSLPWWLGGDDVDAPAPFVSQAYYTGHLDGLNLATPGDYDAELTVELVLE